MGTPVANQGGKHMQNCRIYIGRISHNVQTKDLEDIFSKYGSIAEVRMNRNFAFIQYLDEQSAQKAITEENGKLYFGKKLDVQFARAPQNDGSNKPAESPDTGRDRSPLRGNDRFEPKFGGGGGGGGMGWGGGRGGNDGRVGFRSNETDSPRDFMGGMRGGWGGRGGGNSFRSPMQGDRRGGDEGVQFSPFRPGGDQPGFNRDNFGGTRGPGNGGGTGTGAGGGGGGVGGVGGGGAGVPGIAGAPPAEQPPPFRAGSDAGGGPPPFRAGADMRDPTPPFRGPQGSDGSGPPPPFRNEPSPWAQPPDPSSFNRTGGPPITGSPYRSPQPDGPPRNQLRPPTQQPGILSTPISERVNDIEIIVLNKAFTEYGEFIERRLKALGFTVDVLFPNEEVPIGRVLGNIASRGTLYSVIVSNIHQQHRSLTLHILHGLPQEHRNMPVEDALTLISRNFDSYIRQCKEKRGKNSMPPENIRHLIEQILSGKELTGPQYEKLIQFFAQEKQRVDPSSIVGDASSQEAVLQNRILNILNKTGAVGTPEAVVQPPPQAQKVGSTPPLLNDPSVQKALDSLIQGDLLRKIAPQPQVYNRF